MIKYYKTKKFQNNKFRLLFKVSFACFFLMLFFSLIDNSYAKNNNKKNRQKKKLEEIQEKVTISEKNLKRIIQDTNQLRSEVDKSQNAINKILEKKSKMTQTKKENEEKLRKLEKDITLTKRNAARLLIQSRGRIVALYKERPMQDILAFLFSENNEENSSRASYYISKIRKHDKKLVLELARVKEDYIKEKKEQQIVLLENERLEKSLLEAEKSEQKQLKNKKNILSLLSQKEETEETELNELRMQARAIEDVLNKVTSGDKKILKKLNTKKNVKKESEEIDESDVDKEEEETEEEIVNFVGTGLYAKRGMLPLPVSGTVVKRFGKHRVQQFKDFVMSNGLEFEAKKNASVLAVSTGKVIYVGTMPGYGNLAILDHGERYYTIYSHLNSIRAKVGKVIKTGDIIGKCEASENGKSLFYFEIRKNGKPVDPKQYLKS